MTNPDQATEITIKFLFNGRDMDAIRRAVDEMNLTIERLPKNTSIPRIPWTIESEIQSAIGMHVYALRNSQRKQDSTQDAFNLAKALGTPQE